MTPTSSHTGPWNIDQMIPHQITVVYSEKVSGLDKARLLWCLISLFHETYVLFDGG